jgi:hypothetical protein
MAFIKDTFTDTDGTLLENHSPDTGGAWSKVTSNTSAEIQSDQLSGGDPVAEYVNDANPPTSDYEAYLTAESKDSDFYQNDMRLRWDTANNNGYRFRYDRGVLKFQVRRIDNGNETLLSESSQTYQDSFPWTHKVSISGSTLKQWSDGGGTLQNDTTDSTYTAANKFGLFAKAGDFDDLQVIDTGSVVVTDNASIASATANSLQTVDSREVFESATPVTAATTLLSGQTSTAVDESSVLVSSSATPLVTDGSTTTTDGGTLTGITATPRSAHGTGEESVQGQIAAATASMLTALSTDAIVDSAIITGGAVTSLTGQELTVLHESGAMVSVVATPLVTGGGLVITEDGALARAQVTMLTTAGRNLTPKLKKQRVAPEVEDGEVVPTFGSNMVAPLPKPN